MGNREGLLAAVQARLDHVAAKGDLSPVLAHAALADAQRLTTLLHDGDEDLPARYALGWFHWYRFEKRPDDRSRHHLEDAIAMFTPCFIAGTGELPELVMPAMAAMALPVAVPLLQRAIGSADRDLLSTAVDLWQRIVNATPVDDPSRAGHLSNLGVALRNRCQRTGALADLDAAIEAGRAAMEAPQVDDPSRAGHLSNLGVALRIRFERTGEPADLDAAIEALQAAVVVTPVGYDWPTMLSELENALSIRFEHTGEPADLDAAIKALQAAVEAVPANHPDRAAHLLKVGLALHGRFERTGKPADLDAAIEALRAAVDVTPTGHPDRAGYLSDLGMALRTRFERTGEPADLDAAIELRRAAVEASPADVPTPARYLANLGVALGIRFERAGQPADLDAAIEAFRAAVAVTPAGDPSRVTTLSNLGRRLRIRFEHTGEPADLDAAIEALQAAVEAIPAGDPYRAGQALLLSDALRSRFGRTAGLADLDAVIEALQAVVDATPAGHPSRAAVLSELGDAQRDRFERTGELADLNAAIETGQAAIAATPADHPSRARSLLNLGISLRDRFDRTGALADRDAAIGNFQAAVESIPGDDPDRAAMLSDLGGALQDRFGNTGTLADLDTAIEYLRAAVDGSPSGDPGRAKSLFNLGMALRTRFERAGVPADLDAAVQAGEAAADATAIDDPGRAMSLYSLAVALRDRFERTGELTDLDAAIEACQAAVNAAPAGHPDRADYLSDLGWTLRIRFGRTGELADLDAAIEACQAAVNAAPTDHPHRGRCQDHLGVALQIRFKDTGELANLDAAIEACQAAVNATPADDRSRAAFLNNLGNALLERFERAETQADLRRALGIEFELADLADVYTAIECFQIAVDSTPTGHPDRAGVMINLGNALRIRFTRTGAWSDLDAAFSAYAQAAGLESAPPSARIVAARFAASLDVGSTPERAGLLERAVGLLLEVTPRHLKRADQEYAIGRFAGLASDAAALALADTSTHATTEKRAARALRLLEAGRAVLLSQVLDTRDDLTDLRKEHPALAQRFVQLRDQFGQPPEPSPPMALPADASTDMSSLMRAAEDRRRLVDQFNTVLAEIRVLDGFASFGLPPATGDLLAQAAYGPVVIFNVSRHRSDALLLTETGVSSVGLPDLTIDTLINRASAFHLALHIATNPDVSSSARKAGQSGIREVLEWLWDAAAEPVLDALGYTSQPKAPDEWPRLWWVPGGLLGLLPLHAAGYHVDSSGDQGRRSVMDRVISSYAPTIRALRYARQHTTTAPPQGRALIVAMPTTPGVTGRMLYVSAEVAKVAKRLPEYVLLTEPDAPNGNPPVDSLPTKANVLVHLPGCTIAHFACHGATDPTDPSKSLLLLHDHDRDPLTVASLTPINLDHAELAYLSACSTAFTSATELIDEAIHLSSAFQLAGFPHVIGTLWEIDDATAAEVADTFYENLRTRQGAVNTSQAADALHGSIRAVRDRFPRTPSLWAAYLHVGA